MPALFVAGTGTDIGKTYVTAALMSALAAEGLVVDVLKPVVSGFAEEAPAGSDPAILLQALGVAVTPETLARVSPWRYRAPLAPNQAASLEGRCVDAQAVLAFCRAGVAACGETLLFIESAGGIMSPLDDELTMLDLARSLAIPILLVTGVYLGTISHTLTAVEVIRAAGLELRVVIVNESEQGPGLLQTLTELRRRLPDVAVLGIAQGGGAANIIETLLANRRA